MVFQNEDSGLLLRLLRRTGLKEVKEEVDAPDGIGAVLEDTERAYEIADALEGGLARELTLDFQHPLRRAGSLWKFRVARSSDRTQYRLLSDIGDFLLYASVSHHARQISIFTYDPDDKRGVQLFDRSRPVFTLTFDESKTQWQLFEERCEHCRRVPRRRQCSAKRRLARVRHSRVQVGDGVFNCMDVQIPGLHDAGIPVIKCAATSEVWPYPQRLVARKPKWNDELDSLVLDFKGRKILSSARNFQLATSERPEHVVCQYSKIGPDTFGLDFRYPLSVAQAFGISLTSLHWT